MSDFRLTTRPISRRGQRARATARGLPVCVVLATSLAGCGWFGTKAPRSDPARAASLAPAYPDAQPEAAARVACSNYAAVIADWTFPRDAIIRGIDSGRATVWFQVDGAKLDILSVSSSDPAFASAAVDTIQKLRCRTATPVTFEVPFTWRSVR